MPAQKHTLKLYKDPTGDWRYHVTAANGRVLFWAEGYRRRKDALTALHNVLLSKTLREHVSQLIAESTRGRRNPPS